jgi:hypothetical protein
MLAWAAHTRLTLERLRVRPEDRVRVAEALGRDLPLANEPAHVAIAHAGDPARVSDGAVEREVHDVNCIPAGSGASAPLARGTANPGESRTPRSPSR